MKGRYRQFPKTLCKVSASRAEAAYPTGNGQIPRSPELKVAGVGVTTGEKKVQKPEFNELSTRMVESWRMKPSGGEKARGPSRDLHGLLTICPPVLHTEDVQKKVPVVLDLTS